MESSTLLQIMAKPVYDIKKKFENVYQFSESSTIIKESPNILLIWLVESVGMVL